MTPLEVSARNGHTRGTWARVVTHQRGARGDVAPALMPPYLPPRPPPSSPHGPLNGFMRARLWSMRRKVIEIRSPLTEGTQCLQTSAPAPSRTSTEPTGRGREKGASNSPEGTFSQLKPHRGEGASQGTVVRARVMRCCSQGACGKEVQ